MALGTVIYWNGASGWISQDDTVGLSTGNSQNVLFTDDVVSSGTISLGASVTVEFLNNCFATSVAVN